MDVYQVDEHPQHVCRALHHTFKAHCWLFSCLRLGKNPDFLPTFRQRLAIKWHLRDVGLPLPQKNKKVHGVQVFDEDAQLPAPFERNMLEGRVETLASCGSFHLLSKDVHFT